MADRVVSRRRILALRDATARATIDELAGEEPLEVRVDGRALAVTMRTPGNDFELAIGFCLSEGVLDGPEDVATVRYCVPEDQEQHYNTVDVRRRRPREPGDLPLRHVPMTSACGVCGTASIDALRRLTSDVRDDPVRLPAAVVAGLGPALRHEQRVFDRTGGLHAAGLFSAGGDLLCLREDVGRHNAVDKAVGWAAMQARLPLTGCVLFVSGRVAFEIVAKALTASIPVVAAVSAPTSLAVDLAEDRGLTLVGFVRGDDMNIYTHGHRIDLT